MKVKSSGLAVQDWPERQELSKILVTYGLRSWPSLKHSTCRYFWVWEGSFGAKDHFFGTWQALL